MEKIIITDNSDPEDPIPTGKGTFISDSQLPEGITYMQTHWFSFDDNGDSGASTVIPKPVNGEPFPMAFDGANGTSKSAKISFSLDKGEWAHNPYVGFGFSMNEDRSTYNLTGSAGISFWHKGESCYLKVGIGSVTIPGQEYRASIPSNSDWTKVVIPWENFIQPEWATSVPFDNSKVIEFVWQKEGSTGESGDIFIDEVRIEGLEFNTPISSSITDSRYNKEVVSIYPNPVQDILKVSGLSSKYSTAYIYNISGNVVWVSQLLKGGDTNVLNVSKLERGLYFIRFTGDIDSETTIKFIKE